MKKSKVFISVGIAVLTISAFMSKQATTKLLGLSTTHFLNNPLNKVHVALPGYFTINLAGAFHTAFFGTTNGFRVTLVTIFNGRAAYYL